MTRAWFRRRLDTEPRRWVLFLAALDGLGTFALKSADRPEFFGSGIAVGIWLLFAAAAPALGVLGMMAHGRVLWWTGMILRGRARPHEIHAAFAWSTLPFVAVTAPLVVGLPVRAAATLLASPPPTVQFGSDLLQAVAGPVMVIAAVAAVAGAALYVRFLGEAQGFGAWRTIANHVLAIVTGLALLAAGIALAMWAHPRSVGAVHLLLGLAALGIVVTAVEAIVRIASRRRSRSALASAEPGP